MILTLNEQLDVVDEQQLNFDAPLLKFVECGELVLALYCDRLVCIGEDHFQISKPNVHDARITFDGQEYVLTTMSRRKKEV